MKDSGSLKKMLISVDEWERRVAVIESARLVEIYIEKIGRPKITGNIYLGKVKDVVPGMEAAFVDIGRKKNAFMTAEEALYEEVKNSILSIEKVLRPKQSILVQVLKQEKKGKGSRVTSLITIPGRFLVLMPYSDMVGISRRLPDERREEFKELGENIKPKGMGIVIRTAAERATVNDLEKDLDVLVKTWKEIFKKSKKSVSPSLVHKELDLPLRAVRDIFSSDFHALYVDSLHHYQLIIKYLDAVAPELKEKVISYSEKIPLFAKYRVDDSIEVVLDRKVWLKSGGHIVIDTTEALTSIDVNTGKYVGGKDLEETIFNTNMEAVKEIIMQIRLRDIGGIIIIDFIDMKRETHKEELFNLFNKKLLSDRAKSRVNEFSSLGLVEMTRKSIGESFEVIFQTCPVCKGAGHILSEDTASVVLARKILSFCMKSKDDAFLMKINPKMLSFFVEKKWLFLEKVKKLTGKKVLVVGDIDIIPGQFEIILSGSESDIDKFL